MTLFARLVIEGEGTVALSFADIMNRVGLENLWQLRDLVGGGGGVNDRPCHNEGRTGASCGGDCVD